MIPIIGEVIKKSFVNAYDNLGMVLVGSAIWFALSILPAALVLYLVNFFIANLSVMTILLAVILGLGALILIGPATAGVVYLFKIIIVDEDNAEVRDYLVGFKQFFKQSAGVFLLDILIGAVLVADIVLAFRAGTEASKIFLVMAVIIFYMILFWAMMQLYLFPLLVTQNIGTIEIFKKSALLVVDNPGFTIVLGLVLLVLIAIFVVTTVGVLILLAGTVAVFECNALKALIARYDELSKLRKTEEDEEENSR